METRLTFTSSTNFTVPIGTYQTLQRDAYYHGYIKSEKPNISGFLNDLIPALAAYQRDLYRELLEYNDNDEKIAAVVARNIHNVYLRPFTFHGDGVVNIPFRVNKRRRQDFLQIHDEQLNFYDTDFTNYMRTLLVEYSSRTFGQREYLFSYQLLPVLASAIGKNELCRFYCKSDCLSMIPVSVEVSPVNDYNYIVGVTRDLKPTSVRLCNVERIVVSDYTAAISEEVCNVINEYLDRVYTEECEECSD